MSNIKDVRCKPGLDLVFAQYAHHVVQRRRCSAHVPVIHAASHVDHEKRVAWVSISMHACGCVPVLMVLHLAALQAAGAPLLRIPREAFVISEL